MESDTGRKRILVVASDENVRHFCRESLGLDAYRVELASGMHEALGSLRSSSYDLVISDIEVPKLDGIDLYINILKKHPYLRNRFLFIIGGDATDLTSFLSYIQIGYLAKPIKISELIEAVGMAVTGAGPSGDSGFLEKRAEGRFKWEADSAVGDKERGGSFNARSVDISRYGMKVRYKDGPLVPHAEVFVSIETEGLEFKRNARVAWLKPAGAGAYDAGLNFAEPFPVTSVIMLAEGTGTGSN